MVTKSELIVAVEDLYSAVAEGFGLYDGTSNSKLPEAPEEHYDKLARAIIAYVMADPRPEDAVRTLTNCLKYIEKTSSCRARSLSLDELRKDPECNRWYEQRFFADHGRHPSTSALEDGRRHWSNLLTQYRAERAKRVQ